MKQIDDWSNANWMLYNEQNAAGLNASEFFVFNVAFSGGLECKLAKLECIVLARGCRFGPPSSGGVFMADHPHAIPVHCTLLSASQNART